MVGEVGQLRVGDVETDLGLGAELVGEGARDVPIGADTLADDEHGARAQVLAPTRAGRDLATHGTVEAGAGAGLAGQHAEEGGGEREHEHRVSRATDY